MTERALVPAEARLSPVRVFLQADWLAHLVFGLLILAAAAALAVWIVEWRNLRRGRTDSLNSALAFLNMITISAPFFGLTRAAYELMKAAIGLVNFRPAPDIVMLAPALAEAALAILLGATAAGVAAVARGGLLVVFHQRAPEGPSIPPERA